MNRRIGYFAISAMVCLALASCMSEVQTALCKKQEEGEATVKLLLKAPYLTTSPSTRAVDTAFENDINDIVVFVCSKSGDVVTIEDIVYDINPVTTNGTERTFMLSIEPNEDPITLYIYANPSPSIWAGTWDDESWLAGSLGVSYTDEEMHGFVYDLARFSMSPDEPGTPGMAMGAEVSLGVLDPSQRLELAVPMLRAVARADMSLKLDATSGTFVPEEIYAYNAPQYIQLVADADAYQGNDRTKVVSPSRFTTIPAEGTSSGTVDPVDSTTGLFSTIYLSENVEATTDQERLGATCIVIGGYYNGSTDLSYYRVDFDSKITGHPFGQILRNWRYQFNITHVSAPGYATADEAAENLPSSMVLNVVPWSNNSNDIYFPDSGNYFQLSQRGITLPYEAGTSTTVEIVSTLPYTLTLLQPDGGAIDSSSVTGSGVNISNSLYEVDIKSTSSSVNPNGLTETIYELTVTALTDNTSGTNFSDINIEVSTTTVDIPINQNGIPTYVPPRVLHIHSMTSGIGSLGTYPATTSSGLYTESLRSMLLNTANFGTNGTVKLDNLVMTMSSTLDYDADTDAAAFRIMLSNANVLLANGYDLSSASTPSPACIAEILNWLGDPTHVLIMTVDDPPASNTALRAALPYQMQWDEGTTILGGLLGSIGVTPDYTYGSPTGSTLLPGSYDDEAFMNGPFGEVDRDAYFKDNDGIYGYVQNTNIPANVIPLISATGVATVLSVSTPYEVSAMQMGVDMTNRIVWIGEGQIGYTTNMGADADLTMLMGNLWAWITDTVNQ